MASESTISVLSDVSDFDDVPFSPLTIHDEVENVLRHQPMRYVNGGHVRMSVRRFVNIKEKPPKTAI